MPMEVTTAGAVNDPEDMLRVAHAVAEVAPDARCRRDVTEYARKYLVGWFDGEIPAEYSEQLAQLEASCAV